MPTPVSYFTPVRPAEFSEIKKLPYTGSLPDALYGAGILVTIDTTNGGVSPIYGTSTSPTSRPTANSMLNGVTTLFGVTVGSNQELVDPMISSRIDYAGQTPTKRISVAVCVPHRELIVQPIDSNGYKDPTIAVPSNIGKPIALYPQNYTVQVGSTYYWLYAGAVLTTQALAEGYIVGITGDKNLIVRIIRGKWIELA
jgi:hypothetical protein